ncbi:MAG: pirin family protein [Bacteroidetes bacterium]|nr:pirin family protein [Bacteroidota bacterium]
MKHIFHPANERGHNKFSWLDSYHSFSFGHYYDEKKVHFGALRVLNDDLVAPGGGFGTHPHDNMEIVSIPLSGALEHRDSMSSHGIIKSGDVQIMSAGTGISHSEFNHSQSEEVRFLQIWVFPRRRQLKPRYDQKTFEFATGKWQVVVDPEGENGVGIMQDSWFSLFETTEISDANYQMHKSGNGVYFFVLEGHVKVEELELGRRDAAGFWETDNVQINAKAGSRILAIEVPMELP